MGILKRMYLNLLLSSLMFTAAVLSSVDPISEALLGIKSEIVDDSSSLRDWFLPSGENPASETTIYACSWSGVTCNKNSTMVIGLDLSDKNLGGVLSGKQFSILVDLVDLNFSYNSLSGQLPEGIFNLTNLRSLDISRNNFSGRFPKGVSNLQHLVVLDAFSNSFSGPLPPDVSLLQSLKVLNFAGSYFSGPIPSEYGSFKNLDFIHLAGNLLTGNIPSELGMLKTVTHMEIGYNTYHGSIPWQLGNMTELRYLDIAGANISGIVPKELSNLTKLESLFLFRNELTGLIPWEFSRIISLKSLDLSVNFLSGPIPESFSELKNLALLSLMYNDLSGAIPKGIAELPQLDTLLIWNNYFSGFLPEDLGRHSKLKWVDVSTNNLVGEIPPNICAGGILQKLMLFSNNFSGWLSPSLSNCSSLVRLRLEDNAFSGEMSLKFDNLSEISYVDLSRNRFTGGIPSDVSQASKLQYLNVSHNPQLGGMIREELWSLPLLQNFSASSCGVSGNIPMFKYCKSFSVIELSMNNISGSFPSSISSCKRLTRMELANNNLTGHIPVELASLPSISVLDLSSNGFSGSIPMNFGKSSSLKLLNVSFNDISGSIPSEKLFTLMDRSAFLGNPKLCGFPLHSCSHGNGIANDIELGSRRTQKLAWVLIICAAVVLIIALSIFGIVYLREGSRGQWKMVSFSGLSQISANDVLKSVSSIEATEMAPSLSGSVYKAVLPIGVTVSVKKIEWEPKRMNAVIESINRMGDIRHKNLIKLLGFCYNKQMAYILYDYLPNGNLGEKIYLKREWPVKYKIMIGIARCLCFLHHDCYPAIPHGDLKACSIVFDENMEPRLTEFGFKFLLQLSRSSFPAANSRMDTGEFNIAINEDLYKDTYDFGEVILMILTNGRLKNAGLGIQNKPSEILLKEICDENEGSSSNLFQEEVKQVLEVALLCTRSRPSERPSMEQALKLLSGLKSLTK